MVVAYLILAYNIAFFFKLFLTHFLSHVSKIFLLNVTRGSSIR